MPNIHDLLIQLPDKTIRILNVSIEQIDAFIDTADKSEGTWQLQRLDDNGQVIKTPEVEIADVISYSIHQPEGKPGDWTVEEERRVFG